MDERWMALDDKLGKTHESMVKHFDRLAARQCYFEVMQGHALTVPAENAGIDLEKFPNFPEYSWEGHESLEEDESEYSSKNQPPPVSPGHQKDPDYNPDDDTRGKD